MDTYENKYKEALERAKAMIKVAANQDEAIGFANTIFPELKESEDEKVEKAIFGMVYDSDNELWSSYDVTKSDVLAWLEKQGEQKFEMKTAEESLGIDSDTYNKIVDECIFGEQKPEENKGNVGGISANWSEEDEKILGDIIEDVMTLHSGKTLGVIRNKINWLKSLKGRVQTKHEWSEEDSYYINNIIHIIEEINNAPLKRREDWEAYIDWLKSLKCRVQPKQKWSEEDEIYYKRVQLSIEWARAHNRISEGSCDEQLNWLKSLRLQNRWKPSDEQIRALKHAFNDGSITFAEMEILATLYEGLKSII